MDLDFEAVSFSIVFRGQNPHWSTVYPLSNPPLMDNSTLTFCKMGHLSVAFKGTFSSGELLRISDRLKSLFEIIFVGPCLVKATIKMGKFYCLSTFRVKHI